MQVGVMPPVSGIEHIYRCPGDTVKVHHFMPETAKSFKLGYLRQDDIPVTSSFVGCHNIWEVNLKYSKYKCVLATF